MLWVVICAMMRLYYSQYPLLFLLNISLLRDAFLLHISLLNAMSLSLLFAIFFIIPFYLFYFEKFQESCPEIIVPVATVKRFKRALSQRFYHVDTRAL